VTRILLIRHAEAEPEGGDPLLSSAGTRQAIAVADRLADERVARILHSPKRRARLTADALASRLGCPIAESSLLDDRTPVPSADRWDDYPAHRWDRLRQVPADERDEDGVALTAAWNELIQWSSRADSTDHGTVVLVTHAFVISWFVSRALDAPPAAWMQLPVANTSITEIALRPLGDHSVHRFNDRGHL
jgi:broad specificity phosphatase PhoE